MKLLTIAGLAGVLAVSAGAQAGESGFPFDGKVCIGEYNSSENARVTFKGPDAVYVKIGRKEIYSYSGFSVQPIKPFLSSRIDGYVVHNYMVDNSEVRITNISDDDGELTADLAVTLHMSEYFNAAGASTTLTFELREAHCK